MVHRSVKFARHKDGSKLENELTANQVDHPHTLCRTGMEWMGAIFRAEGIDDIPKLLEKAKNNFPVW